MRRRRKKSIKKYDEISPGSVYIIILYTPSHDYYFLFVIQNRKKLEMGRQNYYKMYRARHYS
jgi:hypothetical protein